MVTRVLSHVSLSWVVVALLLMPVMSGAEVLRLPLESTDADPEASGRVDFEVREDRTRLSIEVEDVASATSVSFSVGGTELGTEAVTLGVAELHLDSRLGDSVPNVTADTLVEVANADTSTVILFRNGEIDDTPDAEPEKLRLCLAPTGGELSASGKAVFEVRPDRRRLKIEVEDLASTTNVTFSVEGVDLGTSAVTLGLAELRLDSRLGDSVPEVGVTTLIEVRDSGTDEILLSTLGAGDICDFPEDEPDDGLDFEFRLRAILFDELLEARGNADFRVVSRSGDSYYDDVLRTDLFKFRVQIEDMAASTEFSIAINGVAIGTIETDGLGNGEVLFTSRVQDELTELPLPENFPEAIAVGDLVTIGEVLSGEFKERFEHGDIDQDGDVDDDDLAIVQSLVGFAGFSAADLNGDGVVGQSDILVVRGVIGLPAATQVSLAIAFTALFMAFIVLYARENRDRM